MKTLNLAVAVLLAAVTQTGCLPLLAVAYDQSRQKEQRQERELQRAKENAAYEAEMERVTAEARAREAEADEEAKTNPRRGCFMKAHSRLLECNLKAALMSRSNNPAHKATATAGACDSAYQAALKVCETYPEE